ncbi:DUF1697 domain-containing protein [Paenibacillus contaminans]|uniref:Cytoplasmic protein n=1 Tax=Paenibacillus contaminans TaxID=450362 RepID=A0A329MNI2_9BACL|nr:DUF1697 domain-containing protein [Paenibacillus contaminans]RAV21130.1 cytoplasmic protein [Paenibacillus contaminans]
MAIYIGLLRGINVGGKNKIKMADLKSSLETMGLSRVQTYIQSGNVLFESEEEAETLTKRIELEIKTVFGIAAAVVLRTAPELERIIASCPFDANALSEGESIQLTLLTETPAQEKIALLSEGKSDIDEFRIAGLEIYLLFRQSVLDSKLAANLQKLGSIATTRNWNTIVKLDSLAKAMEA